MAKQKPEHYIEIYERPLDEGGEGGEDNCEYEVSGHGDCDGLYDDETFEGVIDAEEFALQWQDEAKQQGIDAPILRSWM